MEIRHYRDLNHSYMVLNHRPEEKNSYQYRMLTANRVNGLLPCSVHSINGETYLYYTVDSRISIENQYAVRKMTDADLEKLIQGIAYTLRQMDEYLLSEDGLIFDVKSVYAELSTGEYSFACCPGKEKTCTFAAFAEQLLELTDHEDEQAVQRVYRLCEIAENDDVALRDSLKMVRNEEKVPDTSAERGMECHTEAADTEPGTEDVMQEEENAEEEGSGILRHLILAALFAIVFASICLIRMLYELTYRENILSLTVMTISLLMTVLSLYLGIRASRKADTAEKGMSGKRQQDDGNLPEEYLYESIWEQKESGSGNRKEKQEDEDCGETIVLNSENMDRISRLYSRNTDASIQIGLEHLPLTLGKMSGCVDQVLFHSSVSRIHARIYRDPEKGICIRDLNSTNGTFRNGIRLQPEESAELLPGDEICFGNLIFDYR